MQKDFDFIPMTMWAAEDIPSNRLYNLDIEALTDSDLLSIIIGSGSQNETAVELARRILIDCDNRLSVLAKKKPRDLEQFCGMGRQKAARVLAAIELGKRRQSEIASEITTLECATRTYRHMEPIMQDLDVEEFWVLFLNQNYGLIRKFRLSRGGLSETNVDIRIIIREAVLCNATQITLCHNHPSGSLRPSRADDILTKNIRSACELMHLRLVDHVIITDGNYYSYKENGKL